MRRVAQFILFGTLSLPAFAAPDMPGHMALQTATPCLGCHAQDGQARWSSNRWQACTSYCQSCHAPAEMGQHHPVDTVLTKIPSAPLPLSATRRTACFTCHDLSRQRFDRVRWKSESLFGRLFRKQNEYKTYFLTLRNDRGQLCLACH
jgi:hypothetical protein